MKKRLAVKFASYWQGFDPKSTCYYKPMCDRYEVVHSDKPDILFHSCYSGDWRKYDCVRIATVGECAVPNFNQCDYAMSYERVEFLDRHIWGASFTHSYAAARLERIRTKHLRADNVLGLSRGFCSFVQSNKTPTTPRNALFTALSKYKRVDAGGGCMNNVGGKVKDLGKFQREHRFALAFEHASSPGYLTEKLFNALADNTVPIYYGAPDVELFFNPESFINCNDCKTVEEMVERVKRIDQSPSLYERMQRAPAILPGSLLPGPSDHVNFVLRICDQVVNEGAKAARRRPILHASKKGFAPSLN